MLKIKELLAPKINEIIKDDFPMTKLPYELYRISLNSLDQIISYDWMGDNSKIALLGGIIINCEGDGNDRFLPLKFEIQSKNGKRENLLWECFGDPFQKPTKPRKIV